MSLDKDGYVTVVFKRGDVKLIVDILFDYRQGPDNDFVPDQIEDIKAIVTKLCDLAVLENPY